VPENRGTVGKGRGRERSSVLGSSMNILCPKTEDRNRKGSGREASSV
jgi:hypothetical protein